MPKAGEDLEKPGLSYTVENSQFLIRLNRLLPYNPATTPLHVNSREMKTYVHKKLCTLMSTEALSIIVSNHKTVKTSFTERMVKHTLAYATRPQ